MYTKPRSIHDGNNCYEESLVSFKLHDEAFYLPPRSKTLVKVCINKVFRPSNPHCAIRYYSSAIDSAMFHDQLYILKRGEQSIKHSVFVLQNNHKVAPQDIPQDRFHKVEHKTSIKKNDTKYVYKRLSPEVNWKVGDIAFYRKSSGEMMEVQIKQVMPSSFEHPITRYHTSLGNDLLLHNELYTMKMGRQ